jgi:hypothetical protein
MRLPLGARPNPLNKAALEDGCHTFEGLSLNEIIGNAADGFSTSYYN